MRIKYREISAYQKYLIKMNEFAKFWYMVKLEIQVTKVEKILDSVIIPSEKELSSVEIEDKLLNFIKLSPKKSFLKSTNYTHTLSLKHINLRRVRRHP